MVLARRGVRAGTRYVPAYLLTAVFAIAVYFVITGEVVKAVLYDVLVVSGAVAVIIGVRRHRPASQRLWYCVAASTLFMAAGDFAYGFQDLVRDVDPIPMPSWADAFYVAAYPFLLAGVWGLARRRLPSTKLDTALDVAVVCLGAAIGVAGPLLSANAEEGRSLAAVVVSSIYPIADVALLAAASFLLLERGGRNSATQLLVASLVALFVGDVAFAYLGSTGYNVGAAVDITWMAHAVFLGAAALHPQMTSIAARPQERYHALGLVRIGIIAAALVPLAIAPVPGDVMDGLQWLLLPARLALIGAVLVRLVRLSRAAERAHTQATQRAWALAMAQEEMAYISEGAADAIICGDNNGVITAWNRGAERMIGLPASEVIGLTIDRFMVENIAPWVEAFRNMLPGDIRGAVLPARRADGTAILVDVRVGVSTAPSGETTGFVAVARDAAEAIVARSATVAGELDPATVLENVRAIVGRLVDVPAVSLVIFDREAQSYHEVLTTGQSVAIHLPDTGALPSDAIARLRDLPTVFRARDDAFDVEPVRTFLDRVGAERAVGVTIRHATLGPVGMLLIALGSSESAAESVIETVRHLVPALTRVARSVMLADEEQNSARRTAEIDGMRADFSEFVRHDMCDQVATIRSAVDVLADDKIELGETWRRRLLANLRASVETLEKLVGDVATAGLVVDGRFPCALREICDFRGLIKDSVDAVQQQISQPIELVVGDLPPIKGDTERLGQVLTHLITNAAKFSPPTAPITVTASFDSGVRRVRIAVRDRGIGIAVEDQPLVFRRFARIARLDGSDGPDGTGLGLFIAQGIVESHGGRISVTSRVGEGSVFYVDLPAQVPVAVSA